MAYIQLVVPRIAFSRIGLSSGRDWKTVTGVRLTYKSVAGSTGVVKFDDLIVKVGADGKLLAGVYNLRMRYEFSDGLFNDQSPASAPTGGVYVNGQAIKVTIPPATVEDMDSQVTAVKFFLFSDQLGAYFQVRDYLDLKMSKFSPNEFDFFAPTVYNQDDMFRHCTAGLLPGQRFSGSEITQSLVSSEETTEVPGSASPSLVVSSKPNWVYSAGKYEIQTVNTYEYISMLPADMGVGASSIYSVSFTFSALLHGYPDGFYGLVTPFIQIGGIKYYGIEQAVSLLNSAYTGTWTVSPATGLPFTESELGGAVFGVRGRVEPGYQLFVVVPTSYSVSYLTTVTTTITVGESYNPYFATISTSDTDMLLDNIVLDTAENEPPDDVLQIIGPHYGKMLCVTRTYVYPSQAGRPSAYKYSHAFRLADGVNDRILWAIVVSGSVFVGTTSDIFRVDGDFQEQPNGTININVVALGIGNPPVDEAHAVSDDMLVYHASDSYRVLVGNSSTSLKYNTALLYEGHARHGVYPSDPSSGVQSAAFGHRGLHVLYPDTQNRDIRLNEFVAPGAQTWSAGEGFISMTAGLSTPSSSALRTMELDLVSKEWMPRTYPVNITCLYRTSSGRLVGGTLDGKVVEFEIGNSDLESPIEVNVRTPYLDNGLPLTHKELFELALTVDTTGNRITYSVHDDINTSAIMSDSVQVDGRAVVRRNMDGLKARRFQLRIEGSLTTLRLYDFNMSMRPVPQHRTYLDTGNIRVGSEEFHWFRQIRLMMVAQSTVYVDVYFDEALLYTETLTTVAGSAKIYTIDLQRGASGRQPRLVIRTGTTAAEATTEVGFEVYWIEWVTRTSGRKNKQPRIRWDSSTNDNVPPE